MYDSIESERFIKLIASKEKYFNTLTGSNSKQRQFLQAEIMFLKNDILPIVLKNTVPLYCEVANYAIRGIRAALELNCNGVMFYIPLSDKLPHTPKIGIINERDYFGMAGGLSLRVGSVSVMRMDGASSEPSIIEPVNLLLNEMEGGGAWQQ